MLPAVPARPRATRPRAALRARVSTPAAGLAGALVCLPGTAAASVLDLFGYGARGVSLAGAAATTAEGHAAVYYNPAGLGFERHRTFSLGYQHAVFALELDGTAADVRDAPATLIGMGIPLPLGGFMAERLALGAAFVIPFGSVLLAEVPRPGEASFVLLQSRAQTVSLQLGGGLRLTDALSVGAGFIALAELGGSIQVAPNETGRIGSTVHDELLADYAPTAGVLLRPAPGVAFAVVYRGESKATFDLPLDANLGETFPLPVPPLAISGVAQYDPRQVAFEVSGTVPGAPVRVAGGATWKQWSRFPNPIVYTATRPEDAPQPPPGFGDTWVLRTGAEGTLPVGAVTLSPRVGYAREGSPAPPQTGFHGYVDNDRHIVGLGLGLAWETLRLDLGGQWHHLSPRDFERVDGTRRRHDGEIFAWGAELGVHL
jgi:long-subunit fatty acid transport protein